MSRKLALYAFVRPATLGQAIHCFDQAGNNCALVGRALLDM